MKINTWLKSQDIAPLDDEVLLSIEEFLGGTQLSVAIEAMEVAKDHYAFVRGNMLTKREQFAGLAMTGLVRDIDKYANLDDMKTDAYAVADVMMENNDDIT